MITEQNFALSIRFAHGRYLILRMLAVLFFCTRSLHLLAATVDPANLAFDQTDFDFFSFVGPFHAVLLHFPFGFITIACLLELVYWRNPQPALRNVMFWLIPLSVVCLLVVGVLGLFLASGSAYDPTLTIVHRNYGFSVTAIAMAATGALAMERRAKELRQQWRKEQSPRVSCHQWTVIFRMLLILNLGILVGAGHSGGNLTHGTTFLTKNAPGFLREFLDNPDSENISVSDSLVDRTKKNGVYVTKVEPILRKHCLKCHGPEKQKGDYRVDDMKILFAGGESEEAAIVPGNPGGSKLIQGILLPEDDDDAMPPEGKGHLSDDESLTLIKWIRTGASTVKIKG